MSYVNLHVHTSYSTLDGHLLIPSYVEQTQALGHRAAAITDHGTLAGVPAFAAACRNAQITPIIGLEAYVEPNGLASKKGPLCHLTLLAISAGGYANLVTLATIAATTAFYRRPRIDLDLLARHSEGIACLSGCLASELARLALADERQAIALASRYKELFGERYFLELQDHGEFIPEQRKLNRILVELARSLEIPLAATNDAHFCFRHDYDGQKALTGVATAARAGQEKVLSSPYAYLRTNEEMAALFPAEALHSTLEIAAMVQSYPLGEATPKLPRAPQETGEGPMATLKRLAQDGLARRCQGTIPSGYQERLVTELAVIEHLAATLGENFPRYFLIVADLCQQARQREIRYGPRGSAAGSIICWSLGISEPDPVRHGLLFERFLNPHRIELPDIDLDVADTRRDELFAYLAETYGLDHVARIATYTAFGARAALRAAGRYLEPVVPQARDHAALLAGLIPDDPRPGGMPLTEAVQVPAFQQEITAGTARIVETALQLEGRISAAGTHPAGVVIADRPVSQVAPLARAKEGTVIPYQTQYEMGYLEQLGLLKIDLLGLSTLSVIEQALAAIEQDYLVRLDPWSFPLDDRETWQLIQQGDLLGLFQIGSTGLSRAIAQLAPATLDDLALAIAIYRPGPMANLDQIVAVRHGKAQPEPVHPVVDAIVAPTYGIPVFQEQILQIARDFAGYTLAEADLLRKAIGKKKRELMEQEARHFAERARALGHDDETIARIWAFIAPHADYSFNRSHAICYAYVAYQSAYLKAHFPAHFYAAALTVEATAGGEEDAQSRIGALVREASKRGIAILPPSLEDPAPSFVPRGMATVRAGLCGIKGLPARVAQTLAENAPYHGLEDLIARAPQLDKTALRLLAQAGALPWISRASIVDEEEKLCPEAEALLAGRKKLRAGMIPLPLEVQSGIIPRPEHDLATLLAWEQHLLGFTHSPLPVFPGLQTVPVAELAGYAGRHVTISGVLAGTRRHIARRSGKPVSFCTVLDATGTVQVIVFPKTWAQHARILVPGTIIAVHGKVTQTQGEPAIYAERLFSLAEADLEERSIA